jgi:AraC-like DNA-binding protein
VRKPKRRTLLVAPSPAVWPLPAERGPYDAQAVDGWDALAARLEREHPATVALVDPYAAGDRPHDAFWELLRRFPSATVVAAFETSPARVGDMRAMVGAGVSEFVNPALDAGEVALRRVEAAHARPLKRRVDAELSAFVSADARVIVQAASEAVVDGGGVEALAARFGANPRTLIHWCARAALPEPRRLLVWMRAFLAALLLDDPGRPIASAAFACGYATDRSLRRMLKGVLRTDREVRELRGAGLFESVASEFNHELRSLREERRRTVAAAPAIVPMQADEAQLSPTRE